MKQYRQSAQISNCEERIAKLKTELSTLKKEKKTPEIRIMINKIIARIQRNNRWITELKSCG